MFEELQIQHPKVKQNSEFPPAGPALSQGKEIILPLSVFFGAAVLMGKLALEIQWEN